MEHSPGLGAAVAMGLLQGVTEFLPVSSDGHLAAFAIAFRTQTSLALVVLLHLGTLLATLLVLAPDVSALVRAAVAGLGAPRVFLSSSDGVLLRNLCLSSLPTALIGLLLERQVQRLSALPAVVGTCLLASGLIVLSTRGRDGRREHLLAAEALAIGVVQGAAVLPGLSRSGATIALAMALGLSPGAAFRYSFLLSIPAVTGALLLELVYARAAAPSPAAWVGTGAAFASGALALHWLRKVLMRDLFWRFALYLIPLGLGVFFLQPGATR